MYVFYSYLNKKYISDGIQTRDFTIINNNFDH